MEGFSKHLFEMGVSMAKAEFGIDVAEGPDRQAVYFVCQGCGNVTLNFGDHPYCSYLCRWTPREGEAKQ